MSEWIKVASSSELVEGQHIVVDLDGSDIIIFMLEGHYYALEDICSHDGSDISGGEIEGGCIVCPRHGARFDIKTGQVKSAPAYEDIESFEVKVENGDIYVNEHRW